MNNPIVQRELISQLRSGKTLAVQVLLVTLMAALIILRWPVEGRVETSGKQAVQVLQLFAYGMMVALMLMVPAFPATTIVREKRNGTLALLLNASMGRWSILFGKMAGALGLAGLLVALSLPGAAACYVMGGVGLGQLGWVYAILVGMVVQYAALGLMVSTLASTSESAMRITFGGVLALSIGTLLPYMFLRDSYPQITALLRSSSPITAMMEALGDAGVADMGERSAGGEPLRFVMIAAATSVLFLFRAAIGLDYRMFDKARPKGKITDERHIIVRIFRRIMFLWFFDPQRRSGMIGPLTNPVMIKEFRTRKFGRSHWAMRIFAFCLVTSMALSMLTVTKTMDWGIQELGQIVAVMQFAIITLLTPSLAAGFIAAERESGGWTILRTTPLSARRILVGKFISAAVSLIMMLIATIPCYFIMMHIALETAWLWRSGITIVLACLLAMLLSATISSFCRTTAVATAVSYAALLLLCVGTMVFWLGRGSPFTHDTVQAGLVINPLAATLHAVGARGFADYRLLPANWYITGAACVICLIVLIVQTRRLTQAD